MAGDAPAAIAGVILAGGQSRRMGVDKALIDIAGRPLVARVIARFAGQAAPLAINANGDPSRFAPFGLPVVPDLPLGFAGPLAGILAAMRWAEALGIAHVVTVPADTPLLPLDLVLCLVGARGNGEVAVARSGGQLQPVFAVWPAELAKDLERWLANSANPRVDAWLATRRSAIVDFDPAGDPFFNVNTPDDAVEAARRLAARA